MPIEEVASWPWEKRLHYVQAMGSVQQWEEEQMPEYDSPDGVASHAPSVSRSSDPSVTPNVSKHKNVITTT